MRSASRVRRSIRAADVPFSRARAVSISFSRTMTAASASRAFAIATSARSFSSRVITRSSWAAARARRAVSCTSSRSSSMAEGYATLEGCDTSLGWQRAERFVLQVGLPVEDLQPDDIPPRKPG